MVRSLIFDTPLCRLSWRKNRRTGRHHRLPCTVRSSIRRRASRQYQRSRICPLPLGLLFTNEGQAPSAPVYRLTRLPCSMASFSASRRSNTSATFLENSSAPSDVRGGSSHPRRLQMAMTAAC